MMWVFGVLLLVIFDNSVPLLTLLWNCVAPSSFVDLALVSVVNVAGFLIELVIGILLLLFI